MKDHFFNFFKLIKLNSRFSSKMGFRWHGCVDIGIISHELEVALLD